MEDGFNARGRGRSPQKMNARGSLIMPVAILILIAGGAALYFLVDPASSRWMPKCMFRHLTGLECPGCGAQRMWHALLHGDFAAAWEANAFLLIVTPLLALMLFSAMTRRQFPRLYNILNSPTMIIIISAGICVWFILRNFLL